VIVNAIQQERVAPAHARLPSQERRQKGGITDEASHCSWLMLATVLVPLMGVAHADLKSDEAIEQAP